MTLKQDIAAGTAWITCDSCPDAMEAIVNADARLARQKAVDLAKLARWSIEKRAGDWQHFCPSCSKSRNRGSLL